MNKSKIYLISIGLFILGASFIISKYSTEKKRKESISYFILERKGPSAETAEWTSTRNRATTLYKAILTNQADIKSMLGLASLFVQEARITGNYTYYDKAAMKYVNDVLKKDTINFEALTLKSLLFLSQHHFADGLAIAEKAKAVNPYNAFVYGILVDGNVEMGNYDAAVDNSDKMVSIRPDIRSYSRISYLREIYGDYPGAIEAMKLAIGAGVPGDENTEWCRVQLGKLYEYTGDMQNAEMQYTIALDERPAYAFANAGKARIAAAQKDYSKAISLYLKADSLISDYTFKEELADLYHLSGENEKAKAIAKEVIAAMSKDASGSNQDENIGHYVDQELAYAYLKIKNYDKALYHAMQEYNRRPANIDVNETLAWVYYNKNDFEKALPYIKTALKTKSKNPRLLCRAGLIYSKTGDNIMAKSLFLEALKNNPVIAEALKAESIAVLKNL
ncbi:MAG: tetratricopeptide repeat protein [Bacteroidota bacterium]